MRDIVSQWSHDSHPASLNDCMTGFLPASGIRRICGVALFATAARNAPFLLSTLTLMFAETVLRYGLYSQKPFFVTALALTYDPSKSNCEGFGLPYFYGFCRN